MLVCWPPSRCRLSCFCPELRLRNEPAALDTTGLAVHQPGVVYWLWRRWQYKPLVCSFTSVPPLRWPAVSPSTASWPSLGCRSRPMKTQCGNCTAGRKPLPWRKAFKMTNISRHVRGQLVTSQPHRLVCLPATGVRHRQPFRPIRSLVWQSAGRFRGFIAGAVL